MVVRWLSSPPRSRHSTFTLERGWVNLEASWDSNPSGAQPDRLTADIGTQKHCDRDGADIVGIILTFIVFGTSHLTMHVIF